jgi:hypothetical protein
VHDVGRHRDTMAVAASFGEQESAETSQLRRFKHVPGNVRFTPDC